MGIHSIPGPLPGLPSVPPIPRPRAMKTCSWCRIWAAISMTFTSLVGQFLLHYPTVRPLLVQCPPSPVPRNLPEETPPNPDSLPLPVVPPVRRQTRQAGEQATPDRNLGFDTRMLGDSGKVPGCLWLLKSLSDVSGVSGRNTTLYDLSTERESIDC